MSNADKLRQVGRSLLRYIASVDGIATPAVGAKEADVGPFFKGRNELQYYQWVWLEGTMFLKAQLSLVRRMLVVTTT